MTKPTGSDAGSSWDAKPTAVSKSEEFVELDRTPTPREEFEERFLGEERHKTLVIENRHREQEIEQRRVYAERAYGLTQTWVGFIIVVTSVQFALSVMDMGRLTPNEFIAVLTSTTASILGFWALVGRGLFPVKPPNSVPRDDKR